MPKSKAPSAEPTEDTILAALFYNVPPHPQRYSAKRHRDRDEEESLAWKKEHTELEAARRASLIDEEAC